MQLTAIPLVTYGSDIGLQAGAASYLYQLDREGQRGDWGALGFAWSTHGPRGIETKGELLRLFDTSLRALFQAKVWFDPEAPYWGEGAGLGGLPVAPGAGNPPDPFRWRSSGPWLSLILRGDLLGPLGWWVRYRFTDISVADPGEALRAGAPPGRGGGPSSLVHLGLVYDRRDRPSSPRRGVLADASIFASPPLSPLAAQQLAGGDVGLRVYVPLWRDTVLAFRGLYDLKLGDVPFYERSQYEGLTYGEGLGGNGTVRGLARDRLSGEEKLLAGVELRAWLTETRWLGRRQQWGVSAGGDAGRARDRGHAPVVGAGAFGGVRALLDEAVVIRFEVGFAGQGATAYYLAFDEAF
ncbi:hypothetical protein [Anaeromyxobacter diazotrophicus]|uniref:Bacterial surface antigen (D15) domain-containing protein n=1 Tax=Anaeromyxobacter diazotrophicus TaxID=2590199 RepID=A0A7I9VGB9_9BACT|nr:hypothetical protein [Anaeromyxobacter diazotrophicus]GEJ55299.1 hypothetical protein AMYX_00400 [Anaeromyxobacter diazotrophicus]